MAKNITMKANVDGNWEEVNPKTTIEQVNGLAVRKDNTSYQVGDTVTATGLPSWAKLECTTAGTTGSSTPDFSTVNGGGGY